MRQAELNTAPKAFLLLGALLCGLRPKTKECVVQHVPPPKQTSMCINMSQERSDRGDKYGSVPHCLCPFVILKNNACSFKEVKEIKKTAMNFSRAHQRPCEFSVKSWESVFAVESIPGA